MHANHLRGLLAETHCNGHVGGAHDAVTARVNLRIVRLQRPRVHFQRAQGGGFQAERLAQFAVGLLANSLDDRVAGHDVSILGHHRHAASAGIVLAGNGFGDGQTGDPAVQVGDNVERPGHGDEASAFFNRLGGFIGRPILEAMSRLPFVSWVAIKTLRILLSGKDLMKPRIFVVGLVVSVIAWSMEAISLYIVMRGFGLPGTLTEANFVYCFSTILGALSMLPGGIGGTEASMIGLFSYLGISYSDGLPAVILIRLCTLWYAIFAGMAFSLYLLSSKKRLNSSNRPV